MTGTILIVEDDQLDRTFVKRAISSVCPDVIVETACDGRDALDRIQAGSRPDIVVTDLRMPRMSGLEFVAHMKSGDETKAIPTIVLSTSSNPTDVDECYSAHANAYVVKPDSPEGYKRIAKRIVDFWFIEAALPVVGRA